MKWILNDTKDLLILSDIIITCGYIKNVYFFKECILKYTRMNEFASNTL